GAREGEGVDEEPHSRRRRRGGGRRRAARRGDLQRGNRLPDRRDNLHRWRPGDEPLMKLFDKVSHARNWNDEERQILDQVQRMVDEVIAPNAEHIDATGEFPWKNIEAINALGLNAIFVPEDFGGMPMSFALYLEIVSIISEACASTGIIYATNYH